MKLALITPAKNENSYKCSSCLVYTGLFWIFFTRVDFNTRTQIDIY